MDTMNNQFQEVRASDHLHATIAVVLGVFLGMVIPYVLVVTMFNIGYGLTTFEDALFWSSLSVLAFMGLIVTTWGLAFLMRERKMKRMGLYTPSAVVIASILFVIFSFVTPYIVLFLASL